MTSKFAEIEAKLAENTTSLIKSARDKNSPLAKENLPTEAEVNDTPLKPIMEENIDCDRLSQMSIENLNNHINGDLNDSGAMEEETGPKQ